MRNEEQTKMFKIIPFFQKRLNYDMHDESVACYEYTAGFRDNSKKVDICLKKENLAFILIECKAEGTLLTDREIRQLAEYHSACKYNREPVQYCILTNGDEYQFFMEDKDHSLATKPFYTINNISQLNERDIKIIEIFNYQNIDNIEKDLEDFKLNIFLEDNVLSPSESFINYIKKELNIDNICIENIINILNNKVIKTEITEPLRNEIEEIIEDDSWTTELQSNKPIKYKVFNQIKDFVSWAETLREIINFIIDNDFNFFEDFIENNLNSTLIIYKDIQPTFPNYIKQIEVKELHSGYKCVIHASSDTIKKHINKILNGTSSEDNIIKFQY